MFNLKKLTESLAFKIAAVLLSYLMVLICVLTAGATFVMGYYKFYFSNEETVKQEIMSDMARNEANYVSTLLHMNSDLTNYYKDKNIYFEIYDVKTDKLIETNYNGEEYIAFAEDEHYGYIALLLALKITTRITGSKQQKRQDHQRQNNEYFFHICSSQKSIQHIITQIFKKIKRKSILQKRFENTFSLLHKILFLFLFILPKWHAKPRHSYPQPRLPPTRQAHLYHGSPS